MPVRRDSNGRFMAKDKVCSTCETRKATMIRSFAGFAGAFFMCDECQVPPKHAIRVAPLSRLDERVF